MTRIVSDVERTITSTTGMKGMKMSEADYNSNQLSEIVTLNYSMLKSPTPTKLPDVLICVRVFRLPNSASQHPREGISQQNR